MTTKTLSLQNTMKLLKPFTSKSKDHMALNHVYYDNNYLYATNSHFGMKLNVSEFDLGFENKLYDVNGDEVEGKELLKYPSSVTRVLTNDDYDKVRVLFENKDLKQIKKLLTELKKESKETVKTVNARLQKELEEGIQNNNFTVLSNEVLDYNGIVKMEIDTHKAELKFSVNLGGKFGAKDYIITKTHIQNYGTFQDDEGKFTGKYGVYHIHLSLDFLKSVVDTLLKVNKNHDATVVMAYRDKSQVITFTDRFETPNKFDFTIMPVRIW